MALRYYANAPATTLASSCTGASTSLNVTSATGLPITYPYTLILDRGEATEEVVEVTNGSGTALTVTRGVDSTTAFAHDAGAAVEHGISARDVREPNEHINASEGVHGLGGTSSVVGEDEVQVLTNKDLSSATNTFPSTLATDADVTTEITAAVAALDTDLQGQIDTVNSDLDSHEALTTGVHGVTGAVVGTTDSQTLTNKTLDAPDVSDATLTGTTTIGTGGTAIGTGLAFGLSSLTTNASSQVTVTHNLGATPTSFVCTSNDGYILQVVSRTTTTAVIAVRHFNGSGGVGNGINTGIYWIAAA